MSNFNPDDEQTYRDLQEMKSLLSQIENQAQEILNNYNSRKDTKNFKPGNVNIDDSFFDRGDSRRPNLTPILASIIANNINPGETNVDIDAKVEELSGTDVNDNDTAEISYSVDDSNGNNVASETAEFNKDDVPYIRTGSFSGLSASSSYDTQVDLLLNGDTVDSAQASFSTLAGTLYDSRQWNGLIDYWAADDDSFALSDDGSNGISFPVGTGSPTLVSSDSVSGNAVDFNGGDDSLNAGDVTSQMPTTGMTIAYWAKVRNLPSNTTMCLGVDGDNSSGQGSAVKDDGSGNLGFLATWNASTNPSLTQVTGLNTDTWYHVAATYSSGESNLYVNGGNAGSATQTDGSGDLQYNLGTEELIAGLTKANSSYFDGIIDEMMIFNRAISQNEANDLYQAGA